MSTSATRINDRSFLDELRKKRAAILELCGYYGVDDILIFGSVARGQELRDSDIDLLVSCPALVECPDDPRVWMHLSMLHTELEAPLKRKVDLFPGHLISLHDRIRVSRDAVLL